MRPRLAFAIALSMALAAVPAPAQIAEDPRDATTDIGTIRGPLSDFWVKVRSEWAGYLRTEGSTSVGAGPLNQNTRQTPAPNRVWVSLVHGDLSNDTALSHLTKEFLDEWRVAEGRNWPYAQIHARPWKKMSRRGLEQNLIMIGTPWILPQVGPMAERLGFEISEGRIAIGKRRYHGDNLILVFIAPNPNKPEKYALVITGTSDEALLQASHLPYGETDYVLFQGRRLLESGYFEKETETAWGAPYAYDAQWTHHGFAIRESAHYTFWYERDRIPRNELEDLAVLKDAIYDDLLKLLPPFEEKPPRLNYYLYPTVDRKIDETSRDDVVHIDFPSNAVHAVYSRTEQVVEPYLDLLLLMHRALGPTRVPRLERALAIALAPDFQGRDVNDLAGPIFEEARRSEADVLRALRDHDVMTPADGTPYPHDLLLASFMKGLVERHGREAAYRFISEASPQNLGKSFRGVYGDDIGDALNAWAARMPGDPEGKRRKGRPSEPDQPQADTLVASGIELIRDRRDEEAIRTFEEAVRIRGDHPVALTYLARLRFRNGDFEAAEESCRRALGICRDASPRNTACSESTAWSRLTLGRIEALRGRLVAAHVELTHEAVSSGPPPVPTLAEYWLSTMGQSRNQLTIVSHLKREARVSLRNLDWKEAEEELKRALKIDPTDGEAHKLLSEVYHKHHEYWAWQIRYLNEVHPDYEVLGRVFVPLEFAPISLGVQPLHTLDSFNDLVLKGNLELMKAQKFYAVEIQNLHTEGDRLLIERRNVDRALEVYLQALELNPEFFLSHFLIGRCLFLMDRREEARQSFEEVLARRPTDPLVLAWTHTYLGYLALEEDDLIEAQHCFRRALALADAGKVADLAREGLGRVSTIRMLQP